MLRDEESAINRNAALVPPILRGAKRITQLGNQPMPRLSASGRAYRVMLIEVGGSRNSRQLAEDPSVDQTPPREATVVSVPSVHGILNSA
jgi:hypothetical protein